MFAEASDSEQEKWAQSIAKRRFHCEQGVKVESGHILVHPSYQGYYSGAKFVVRLC